MIFRPAHCAKNFRWSNSGRAIDLNQDHISFLPIGMYCNELL